MRCPIVALPLLVLSSLAPAYGAVGAPVLKWQRGGCYSSWCQTGWYSSPAVVDLDGDGAAEVIWGSYSVFVVNGATGELKWKVASGHDRSEPSAGDVGRTWPGVVVADVDGKPGLEVVTAHSGGWVSVYSSSGYFLSGWPRQPTPGNELRSLAVDDLDHDGDKEIIVASTRSDNQWFVYEHTGAIRPGWPQHSPDSTSNGWTAGCFNENIGAADIDGDGRSEIIGPSDVHYIAAYDDNGSQIRASSSHFGANRYWSCVGVHVDDAVDVRGWANCGTEHRPNFADSAPSIADLNGDSVLETVVVGNVYNCGTSPYTSLYQMPFIFRSDRTRWAASGFDWTAIPSPSPGSSPLCEDYGVIETVQPNPVLADVDGDGNMEVLFASYDGKVHAYWLDKTEHGNWPYDVTRPGEGFVRFASEPIVADLDGDGRAEVIFGSWPEKGGNRTGKLHVVDDRGNPIHEVPLPAPFSGDWNGILGAPTVADIDGDGELEIVAGSSHSGVIAFDVPGAKGTVIHWGTGRGSYQRTGYVARSGGGSLTPVANAGPDQTVTPGSSVFLDGSASVSRRPGALYYSWSQTSGPIASLSDGSSVRPSFTAPQTASVLVFSLVVNDGVESSAPDSVTISVSPSGGGQIFGTVLNRRRKPVSGATVTLKGNGVTRRTRSAEGGAYSFSGVVPGNYQLQARKAGTGRAVKKVSFAGGSLRVDLTLK